MSKERVILTGASGRLGKALVPKLRSEGYALILVGRDELKLRELFPLDICLNFTSLKDHLRKNDNIVYLAARNNDQDGPMEDFRAANVDRALSVFKMAENASVKRFIYFSSLHVLNSSYFASKDCYSRSKLEAEVALAREAKDVQLITLRLAAVYGCGFSGKLKFLSAVPEVFQKRLIVLLGFIKPMVSFDKVVQAVTDSIRDSDNISNRIFVVRDNFNGSGYITMKRVIDLGLVGIGFLFVGWLLPLIWIAIKLTSRGPGFFVQTRVGKDNRFFKCYKFRTMYLGTEQVGTHDVLPKSITSIGKWLRKYKIDELPQLWNVLINDMSIVGPRPSLPNQTELIEKRESEFVYSVKPGITGLAQIANVDMSQPAALAKIDGEYIATASLLTDIRIIVCTLLGGGRGDRVSG